MQVYITYADKDSFLLYDILLKKPMNHHCLSYMRPHDRRFLFDWQSEMKHILNQNLFQILLTKGASELDRTYPVKCRQSSALNKSMCFRSVALFVCLVSWFCIYFVWFVVFVFLFVFFWFILFCFVFFFLLELSSRSRRYFQPRKNTVCEQRNCCSR